MEKGYFKGLLGALLGGLIASIPWILVYVYANMIYSILALPIAMGAFKGYQFCNGKIDKKLPFIIVLISIVSITISTFLIIPSALLLKGGAVLSLDNVVTLYNNGEFLSGILIDYIVSLVFTILGISGVIANLKKQISNGEDVNLRFNGNNKKEREKVREYFINRNAISESNSIKLNDKSLNMDTVSFLINQRVIIKNEDKYYYLVDEEEKLNKQNKRNLVIFFSVLIVVIMIIIGLAFSNKDNKEYSYKVPSNYEKVDSEDKKDILYYFPKSDLSGDSGYLIIQFLNGEKGTYIYTDNWKSSIENNFKNQENFVSIVNSGYYKNKNDEDVIYFDVKHSDYSFLVYYIFGNEKLAVVQAVYFDEISEELKSDVKKISDSFKWNL